MNDALEHIRSKDAFICDMDGVIYHGNRLLEGAADFVAWLKQEEKSFVFLTNSSARSPRELKQKMARLGIEVEEHHFYSSAEATATFLASQHPGATAYVIGEAGLINAIYNAGLSMNDVNPDYVVVGESSSYNYDNLTTAVRLVTEGVRLIGSNPDVNGPAEHGLVPACGSLIAPIEKATGRQAYFVGKPNPLMMRHALKRLGSKREDTVIIGDRMDTDIIAGIESEIETILVLTGVTSRDHLIDFPYAPHYVFEGIGQVPGPLR